MKDNLARLRVVGGIDVAPEAALAKKPRKKRPPMKNQMVFPPLCQVL